MGRSYNKIFIAHYRTKLPLMLWGSSGYGKSSVVRAFAQKYQFELVTVHAQYLDPLALFVPSTSEMKELGYVKMYPAEVLHKIFSTTGKTILFLDELTRAREETFNILTELLLERAVFGHKVPPSVMIIAASNFSEEDTGVRELPDAVMQRMTHLIHAPDPARATLSLGSELSKQILSEDNKLMAAPGRYPIYDQLKACPRQIDACGHLAEAGLRGEDLVQVCRGRIGLEAGTDLAVRFEMKLSGAAKMLPERIYPEEYSRIHRAESHGGVLEVTQFLRTQMTQPDAHPHIALYLLEYASPETCRALQIYGFSYQFTGVPQRSNGELFMQKSHANRDASAIEMPGKPWQWYAVKIGKLQSR